MRSFTFKWPQPADEVFVTGTFDSWAKTTRLDRVGQGFERTLEFPDSPGKIVYKFVVDGRWELDTTAPQEKDDQGIVNNILLPEQMDKVEEASQAAAINNLVPDSTSVQLAGAVPLESKKEAQQKDKPEVTEGGSSGAAATLNSAAPDSTTAQLAAAVPLEDKQALASTPGSFPETPAADLNKEVKVDPLPAADGAVNPIKLQPGEQVPKDFSAGAVDSHVTLDKESYEKSDRIPGVETTLPYVTGNMIPESSLPITGANDVNINTVAPESTTANLAGEVPLEPKVPDIVKKSQEQAEVEPEASANSEEVKEKAAVEDELLAKVPEAPSTSEGTAGKGTEKSETDKTGVETVLAATSTAGAAALGAATSAGEVALGAAITAAETAGPVAAGAATKAGGAAAGVAAQASDAAANIASVVTTVATDAANSLSNAVKGVLPGATHEAETVVQEKQKAAIDSVSPEVPAEVKESMREAGASPEAAVNSAAVEEKKGYEAELLEKVKPAEAVGGSSAEATEKVKAAEETKPTGESRPAEENKLAAVTNMEAIETLPKVEPAEAPQAETKPKPSDEGTVLAVEPPQPIEAVKAVDEAKPSETPKPVEEAKPTEDSAPAVTALAAEPPKPTEEVKAVDVAPSTETPKATEETKPTKPATAVPAPTEIEAVRPAVEQAATAEQAAPVEAAAKHAAPNGTTNTTAGASSSKATSDKKKKHRISGFFNKLKEKLK
ncbi:carbohydrate-binding module family 48 protein [Parathielavia appendiculata]|uniref:Carbohydrate-binding module family 48 protein n=1 Tax=Parathielavia appendiculata TaxID=2587402 RepID=A0AAN6Z677_9PEZI|nr:carbohydrate-binding module family 48 protein [Parathielavia appendiculata]